MTPVFRYSDPKGIDEPAVLVSLPSNVRWGDWALAQSADVGSPAMSTIPVDDPEAAYAFVGLRAFDVMETSAPSNSQIIGRFVVQDRTVTRGPSAITSNARHWSVDLVDYNWHLGKRVFTDSDANRPRETPGDRIRWLLNGAAHINLWDMGHVTYPTTPVLDANDYRGQRPTDLLADCCIEGQYNYWVDYNEALGRPELFFMDPDSADYASDLYISNNLYDIDGVTTFAAAEDTELRRSAARVAFGVYLAYQGGAVYVRNDTVGEQFAKIDQPAPMANVRTAARARRVAQKFLDINSTEDDRIRTSVKVPHALVNSIRHGHLLGVKFAHLPGYENWTATRVMSRVVAQEPEGGEDYYRVSLELVPVDAAAPMPPYTGDAYAALVGQVLTGTEPYIVTFAGTGDNPPVGAAQEPSVGGMWTFNTGTNYTGITCAVPMHVRIEMRAQFRVVAFGGTATLNVYTTSGGLVGTATKVQDGGGNWADTVIVDFETDLAAGDAITWGTTQTNFAIGGWIPGTGGNDTALRVGRGSHTFQWGTWVGAS